MALTNKEASVVLGMAARGDSEHDIAAWFGVNQGRIAEIKGGAYGGITAAPANMLPPKGSPGLKGRKLRGYVGDALKALESPGGVDVAAAIKELRAAIATWDKYEA